jgi:hypothetical protein
MPRRGSDGEPTVDVDEIVESWAQLKIACTIAIGSAAGWTVEELAEHMGVSSRQTYTDKDRYRVIIKEIEKLAASLVRTNRREIKAVAVKELRAKMEGMLGGCVAAIQDAIESGDPELASKNAWRLIEQLEGKPTSTVNVNQSGTIRHAHLHVMAPETITAFEAAALRDHGLISRANHLAAAQPTESAPLMPSEATVDA